MFESIQQAPPDPILGLTAAFIEDDNPDKINLGVGVYRDGQGHTPIFRAVVKAEECLLGEQTTKDYLPIDGTPQFGEQVRKLLLAERASELEGRAVTLQAPGGTGALRLAGDFFRRLFPDATVWLSNPTWANHPKVFEAAGLRVTTYPYFDSTSNSLDFKALVGTLADVPMGDVVLLHGCCHNPTGVDPTLEQWQRIAAVLAEAGAIPLVDFAYQGLGSGIEKDAAGLRALCQTCEEVLIANSFSKNFGLYQDRVGSLTVIARTSEQAEVALSHLKTCVRTNFSNPPAHGSAVVTKVLQDVEIESVWRRELDEIRERINGVRRLLVQKLETHGLTQDFAFIKDQRGMFSFSGLSAKQVGALRERHSIYIVGSGRINVAGITEANIDRLCGAIAEVVD